MIDLPVQALRISVPYVLAGLGGVVSERAGVVNIALESMILAGAFGTAVGTLTTGSPWIGLLCGIVSGALVGSVHGLMTGPLRANHIVSGLALNLGMAGLTRLLLHRFYGSSSNSPRFDSIEALGGDTGPLSLFLHPLLWFTLIAVVGVHLLFSRTVLGLRLHAVGENPEAVTAAGLSAGRLRFVAAVLSGVLAGTGGCWLAFTQHQFTDGMSAGRGYIALAALISGRWYPVRTTLACLVFGLAEALQIRFQGGDAGLPVQWVQAFPYLATLAALVYAGHRARPPVALGAPLKD